MKPRYALFLVVCSVALCGASFAATISLQITVETTTEGNEGICALQMTHLGDEPAVALQAILEIAAQRYPGSQIGLLEPGSSLDQEIHFPLDKLPEGVHHGIIYVTYADLNGYPYTALAYARIVHGETRSPTVLVQMNDAELGKEGAALVVSLRNLDSSPLSLALRLALPRELATDDAARMIEIEGRGERAVSFVVRNFSALVGSRYPVFAVADYELDGLHASSLVVAEIQVSLPPQRLDPESAKSAGMVLYRKPLILGLLVIVLLSIAILARRWRG